MANGHGGPRTPAHPASVSGPGHHSARTDGGPSNPKQAITTAPNQPYGEAKQQAAQQSIAPLPASQPTPGAAQAPQGGQPPQMQMPAFGGAPISAPSNHPGEPVTHGAPIGPGGGPDALQGVQQGVPNASQMPTGQLTALLSRYAGTDNTGVMAQLAAQASARGL